VGDEQIINSRTQVVGCKADTGAFLRALKKTGGHHDTPILQTVPNLIHNEMPSRGIGSDAKTGRDRTLDQCVER
jgi:hypothetical protein